MQNWKEASQLIDFEGDNPARFIEPKWLSTYSQRNNRTYV